jgi:hypothetical protein
MSAHRYEVGQHVRINADVGFSIKRIGVCRIVALLPPKGSSNQYRVRSNTEPCDRVVAEPEIHVVVPSA